MLYYIELLNGSDFLIYLPAAGGEIYRNFISAKRIIVISHLTFLISNLIEMFRRNLWDFFQNCLEAIPTEN